MKAILIVTGVLSLLAACLGCSGSDQVAYVPPPVAFHGSSAEMERTVIVPTLDTPMPEGKNVVWSASFQVAWNRLRDDILKGPVKIDKGADVAARLNASPVTEKDLPKGSFYAAAGWVKDGIVEKIKAEMQQRFQKVPELRFEPEAANGFTAYAYLQAAVPFAIPFFENSKPLPFTGSDGKKVSVSSFGIRAEDEYAYDDLRRQVEVLYATGKRSEQEEFILDLCKTSSPNQVIIARIQRGKSLADTLRAVEEKMKSFSKEQYYRSIGPNDRLLIPNMNWEIEHRFAELEKAHFLNEGFKGYWIEAALQNIRFKLDRNGAELERSPVMMSCRPSLEF
jgi:hypothetical protein